MKRKLRVAILFGGRSAEHEISLQSAKNIVEAIDKRKYELVLIGIDKDGRWYLDEDARLLSGAGKGALQIRRGDHPLALIPGQSKEPLTGFSQRRAMGPVDVVFPILHGPFGEDGTVQGFLKLANLPFVGAGVLGSALGMDKDAMKRLLREAGIPTAKFLVFERSSLGQADYAAVKRKLGLPCFVKPANLDSSVGISKVKTKQEWDRALKQAFRYDSKILVEEYIRGREIECSVLGNEHPRASLPGEIVSRHEFYSYDAKYLDDEGATLQVPAKLPARVVKKVQSLAIQTFKVLCCEGMARVDFFLRDDHEAIVNEINTIPGFTKISMYPKLWEVSGLPYTQLIDKLIQLALARFRRESKLTTSI